MSNDSMKEVGLVLIGLILGIYLVISCDPYKTGAIATPLIEECEKSLPRDQFCELRAYPSETLKRAETSLNEA